MQGTSQTEDDRARHADGERACARPKGLGRACCVSARRDALARIDAEKFNDVYVPESRQTERGKSRGDATKALPAPEIYTTEYVRVNRPAPSLAFQGS